MAPPAHGTRAEKLFNFVPPPYGFHLPLYLPPETFLHFPDTHLDENLILKRICILPSLFDDILQSFDILFPSDAQAEFSDDMFAFPGSTYSNLSNKGDAVDVRDAYVKGVAFACTQVASGVILHPDDPTASSIIGWDVNEIQSNHSTTFHEESFACGFSNYSDKSFERFSASSQERIRAVEEHFPVFAIGMMVCPNGEWCLKDMDTLVPAEEQFSDFPWVVNSILTGYAPTPNAIRPADADNSIWQLPSLPPPTTSSLRKSARSSASRPNDVGPGRSPEKTSPSNFRLNRLKNICPAPPRAVPAVELIQRAWIKAVRFDVSVLLFDCGNFLRIGIRQRQTQTLFLSALINVCDPDSKYGKLMLGLHLCILHDVFARLPHARRPSESALTSTTSLKRNADHIPQELPPKRGRTTEPDEERTKRRSANSHLSRLQDWITPMKSTCSDKNIPSDLRIRTRGYFESHPVLTLYLRFHNYNSPTPEVLLSPDHPRSTIYKAATCLPLILTSKLGHGATGQAYTAILGPGYENLPCSRLVVKLAVTRNSLLSLQHEYDVYCHLQSAGVLGIPYIFGYYQDNLRGMGALVMHNVGDPLGQRMDSNKKIKLSAPEQLVMLCLHSTSTEITYRVSLKKILKAIHAQGVLHRDLRSWNMMCNQHGEVSIIDFDCASLRASKEEFSQETARLARFLKGEFVDKD